MMIAPYYQYLALALYYIALFWKIQRTSSEISGNILSCFLKMFRNSIQNGKEVFWRYDENWKNSKIYKALANIIIERKNKKHYTEYRDRVHSRYT